MLILVERDRLADFHIDKLILLLIILCKPLETLLLRFSIGRNRPLALPHFAGLLIWVIAIALGASMWRHARQLPRIRGPSLRWFAIGAAVGIALAILRSWPISFQIDKRDLIPSPSAGELNPVSLVTRFIYQLGYAATDEEPLFRAFLWGYLLKLGWRDSRIVLFQAALFSLAHIYYLFEGLPISFWLIVPTDSLVLGLLVWRSRTIASSMAAHAGANTLTYTIGCLIARSRL
jgi:membrane protease YdiL (CAAX protease family)